MPFPLNILGLGQAHQEAHRKQEMQMSDNQAAVLDLMNNLDRDQLNTLRTVVVGCQDEFTSGMMYGLLVGITAQRFDANFDGQTMEEQLAAEQMVREAEQKRDEPKWEWPNPTDHLTSPLTPESGGIVADEAYMEKHYPANTHNPETGEQLDMFPHLRADGYPIEEMTVEEVEATMKKFNLRISENPGRFICNKCGLEYISLADRGLRDDCHGCAARAAQG